MKVVGFNVFNYQHNVMTEDEKWMKIAIEECIAAEIEGEIPVGAVIVTTSPFM